MLRNPPTTAVFAVPAAVHRCLSLLPVAVASAVAAAAAIVAFVLLVVTAALLLLFATDRFCLLLLVSSRHVVCVYSLVACLDHSWVSRSLESDLVYVRRVLAILSVSPVFGLRLCRVC